MKRDENLINKYMDLYRVPEFLKEAVRKVVSFPKGKKVYNYTINGHFMRLLKPVYVKPGFRLVPCFPNYAINSKGILINVYNPDIEITGAFYDSYIGYEVYVPSKNRKKRISLHRFVALAWVYNAHIFHKIQVNHKDGNKLNNDYLNLEWVTALENINHALETRLRKDNFHVRVFDILTQTEHKFSSISKLGEFLNYKNSSCSGGVSIAITNRAYPESLIFQRYEIKLEGDNTPWYYLGKTIYEPPSRFKFIIKQDGLIIDEVLGNVSFTNKYKIWNTSSKAETLANRARELYPHLEFIVIDRNPALPLQAKNVYTGEVFEDSTARNLEKTLNIPDGIIKGYLKRKSKAIYDQWIFRKKSEDPWFKPEKNKCTPRCIEVTNILDGSKTILPSLRAVGRFVKTEDRKAILNRIKSGKPLGNYLFREISPL